MLSEASPTIHQGDVTEPFDHFTQITALRRAIAFQNPLLDFEKILFIKHDKMAHGERHMVDQYLGFNQKKAGGVYVLENPFSLDPRETKIKSLLADATVKNGRLKGKSLKDQGAFISLELDYNSQHIYFVFTEAQHEKYELPKNETDPLKVLKSHHSASGHHGSYYAFTPERNFQIMRINADGSMSQVKRIAPEVHFPESESAPGKMHAKGRHRPNGEIYGQPWPLSEDFYLCTYSMPKEKHGIYLVDSFGNKELLYQDEKIGCLDPIPFRPRKKPPVIPIQTKQAKIDQTPTHEKNQAMGTVTIMNIYASEYPWPKDTKIKELRIINPFPKPNYHLGKPMIGMADQSLARGILGTVPVEDDGSVHFECPTGMGVYFQALDENGFMVQNMRSVTYLHPGERLSCIGCHESKHDAPVNTGRPPMALQRAPSMIQPEATGSYPLTFPRLVQPVLDNKCVSCHDKEPQAKSLRGDEFAQHGWTAAFTTLARHAWGKSGGNGAIKKNKRSYSLPGQEGFRASGLYKILVKDDHYGIKLTPAEMRRISAWVDCNSNFYGTYVETEKQSDGEIIKPLLGLPRDVPFEKLVR